MNAKVSINFLFLTLLILSLFSTNSFGFKRTFDRRRAVGRAAGDVAYCTFDNQGSNSKVSGEFHFAEYKTNTVRITGQFNTGFVDNVISNYQFTIDGYNSTIIDLTSEISKQIIINIPGASAFECDFSLTVNELVGAYFCVKYKNSSIGGAIIKKV